MSGASSKNQPKVGNMLLVLAAVKVDADHDRRVGGGGRAMGDAVGVQPDPEWPGRLGVAGQIPA
jgi:hypothetical protein